MLGPLRRARAALRRTISAGECRLRINSRYRNPISEYAGNKQALYEPGMDAVIAACFRRTPDAFIDVGANIGQTLLKVLALDPDRSYVGFEPQLFGAFLVDDLVQKNHGKQIILPVGLSDRAGVERLGVGHANDAAASFVDEYRPPGFYSDFRAVVTMRGDDVLEALDIKAGVIKVDVEGAELEVIRGLRDTLRSDGPFVLF